MPLPAVAGGDARRDSGRFDRLADHSHGLGSAITATGSTGSGGILATTNKRIVQECAAPVDTVSIPFLGEQRLGFEGVKTNCKKVKKSLALLERFVNFTPALSKKRSAAANERIC